MIIGNSISVSILSIRHSAFYNFNLLFVIIDYQQCDFDEQFFISILFILKKIILLTCVYD